MLQAPPANSKRPWATNFFTALWTVSVCSEYHFAKKTFPPGWSASTNPWGAPPPRCPKCIGLQRVVSCSDYHNNTDPLSLAIQRRRANAAPSAHWSCLVSLRDMPTISGYTSRYMAQQICTPEWVTSNPQVVSHIAVFSRNSVINTSMPPKYSISVNAELLGDWSYR